MTDLVINRLGELRRSAGLTQQELAFKANLSISTVAKVEQGKTAPALDTARAIAAALGVTIDEIWPANTPQDPEPAAVR